MTGSTSKRSSPTCTGFYETKIKNTNTNGNVLDKITNFAFHMAYEATLNDSYV